MTERAYRARTSLEPDATPRKRRALALRGEEAIYQRTLAGSRLSQSNASSGMDWYAFTLAFKGVFLERL